MSNKIELENPNEEETVVIKLKKDVNQKRIMRRDTDELLLLVKNKQYIVPESVGKSWVKAGSVDLVQQRKANSK